MQKTVGICLQAENAVTLKECVLSEPVLSIVGPS